MNKKLVLATPFVALLFFSALVGIYFVNLASANFLPPTVIPYNKDPPIISILSPVNKTYNANHICLNFTVTKPASWYTLSGSFVKYKGTINWVDYNLDDTKPASRYTLLGGFVKYYDYGHFSVNDSLNSKSTVHYSKNLTGLSEGIHTLVVSVSSTSYYLPDIWKDQYTYTMISYSATVNFIVDTPPSISILSPQNKTYETTDVPLNFTVNETASWIGYSIDGQTNITITGNTTLPELSEGQHSLLIHAKDVAGNTGASETICFSIEPQQSEPFPTWIAATIIIVAIAVVGSALLVYFRKVKKTTGEEKRARPEEVM